MEFAAMSLELYVAYIVACAVIVIVPGPSVTLIVANSLRHGARAGLLNVAGTQAGLAVIVAIVGIGLTSAVEALGHWFDWLRLAGAVYLVWLGWRMLRAEGGIEASAGAKPPHGGFFVQGLLVSLSNPKTLVFFGAFLPQFIDPRGAHTLQIAIMGATALAFAALSDSAYALLSGRAGRLLSRHRVRLMSRLSGGFLIGGGLWLALSRTR
jgi:threonine/homoserine/homoserine lactone efflux protein